MMIFGACVQAVKKTSESWVVRCNEERGPKFRELCAPKLMIVTGLCSVPNIPNIAGKEDFGAPLVHTEGFGNSNIMHAPSTRKLVVIGGGKSAADAVYEGVKNGKEVHWVIRKSGTGPAFFASGGGKGPFKNAFEVAHTRLVASLSPSIFSKATMWTNFLQKKQSRSGAGSTTASKTRSEHPRRSKLS